MRGLLLSLLAGCAFTVHATTLKYKNFNELITEADGIVVGTVQAIESIRTPSEEVYTYVTLSDLQLLHGDYEAKLLTLRIFGGSIGSEVYEVAGAPQFNLGEKKVLFVRGNGEYMVPMVGWSQGVFNIKSDPATGLESLYDYLGNPVYGVRGTKIIRAAQYLDTTHFVSVADAYPGETSDGHVSGVPIDECADKNRFREVLYAPEFYNLIRSRARQLGVKTKTLETVTPGQLAGRTYNGFQTDAKPSN